MSLSGSDFLAIGFATAGLFLVLWSSGSWGKTASRNIYDQQASNKRWSYLLIAVFCGFIGFLGLGVDIVFLHLSIPALGINTGPGGLVDNSVPHATFPYATAIAVAAAFAISWFNYRNAPAMVLSATGARPADPSVPAEKQLLDIVQEMSTAAGLPMPKAYIVEDPDPNAFATGTGPEDGHIAVTSTLLKMMNRDELEGVVSHEMSHLRNQDTELLTLVVALAGAAALLADWSSRTMFYSRGGRSSDREGGGGLQAVVMVLWILGIILAPIISQLMTLAISRHREYLADASGAELTRNPLSLANALEKIKTGMVVPDQALSSHSFGHLCIADPTPDGLGDSESLVADMFASHPPIDKRIAALKEMAYQYAPQQQGEDAAA